MFKNILKLIIIITSSIILTILLCNLYKTYNKNKINKSYLSKYVSNIEYKELTNTIMELIPIHLYI